VPVLRSLGSRYALESYGPPQVGPAFYRAVRGWLVKILGVVGARPNFVKMAPLLREMARHPVIEPILIHTGQHYDREMSERFFSDLEIPPPDVNLAVGSGSHARQTAEVIKRLEPVLVERRPDVVIVVGDVNSTFAAALTAVKLGIPVAHVEAGLRSFDRTMPEEINRLLTDAIAQFLFVTEESGRANLLREGVAAEKIFFVGNVMIDALEILRPKWERSSVFDRFGIRNGSPYAVLTVHRPSNVDRQEELEALLAGLATLAREIPIVFPVHPRVRSRLNGRAEILWAEEGTEARLPAEGILGADPLGYLDFLALAGGARLVLTDSGGLQEEATVLGVPCLTLRNNTERPATVTYGTNRVIGTRANRILEEGRKALAASRPTCQRPPLWDGKAAGRIVQVLLGAQQ
jgi:UDP-N-acetylglucosamine 2-epimerase (non-hydrolysing)